MKAVYISEALGITTRNFYYLMHRLGMTLDEMTDLETVFFRLLEGRSCPLRSRLADPHWLAQAQSTINQSKSTS